MLLKYSHLSCKETRKKSVYVQVTLVIGALTALAGCQEQHPVCKKFSGDAGAVVCQQRGANDLHMFQKMPLPTHHLLLSCWFNLSDTGLPTLSWNLRHNSVHVITRMWANAQRDGRLDEYRWRLC